MQSCLAHRFLVKRGNGGARGRLMNIYFLSNIRPRLACMRTSRKTDFPSSKNNFRGHDISPGLDREPPSPSPHFLLVLSKTKSVTPHFFYISDITNSSSFNGKICRKKSMLENFRANVLKRRKRSQYMSKSTVVLFGKKLLGFF